MEEFTPKRMATKRSEVIQIDATLLGKPTLKVGPYYINSIGLQFKA